MYAFNPNIYANATKNAVDEKSLGGSGGVAATAGNNEDSSQWPLNQSAYQNVANDQVDWAALAQRWIFMKETYPNADMPVAPPPPTISQREFEEQGEAPMEVEKEDEQHDDIFSQITASTQPSQDNNWQSSSDWQSGSQQGNNHWRKSKPGWNTWTNPNIVQNTQFVRAPLLPDPYSSNSSSGANSLDVSSDGYWQRLNNINTDSSNRNESNNSKNHVDSLPSPLDAARRKTLPAWIRQGLEKMEREKQKCAEREQQQAKSAATEQRILPDNVSYSELSSTLQSKSKFDDSDSESDDETLNDVKISHPQILLNNSASTVAASKPNFKSKNEQLQDLMLLVRGALTEILLEVTNEEIRNVATETLSKMRLKAKTAQTVRKTALSSLTGELGLGIYADSDNSGDSSSDESAGENVSNDNDSDYELQETIKRRKSSFEQKAKEIEAILAAEEEKEKSWLGQDDDNDVTGNVSVSGAEGGSSGGDSAGGKRVDSSRNNDKEFGEIQQEKNYLSHGRAKEKKASRFSDSKDIIKTIQIPQPSSTILPSHQSKSENVTVPKTPSSNHKDQNKKDSETSSNSSKNVVVKVEKSKRRNRSSSDDSEDSNNDDNGDDGDDDDDDDDDSSEDSYRSRKYSSHKRHRYDRSRSRSASSDRHHRRRRSSSRHKKSSRSDKRSHRDRESRESSRYSDRKRRSSRSYSKTSSSRHRSRSTRSRSASRSRSSKYSSHRHHHRY